MDEFPVDHELLKKRSVRRPVPRPPKKPCGIGAPSASEVTRGGLENGYALYSPLQWSVTSSSSHRCKDSGCSLADIRRYLARPTAAETDGTRRGRVDARSANAGGCCAATPAGEHPAPRSHPRRVAVQRRSIPSGRMRRGRFRDIDLSCAFAKKIASPPPKPNRPSISSRNATEPLPIPTEPNCRTSTA